MRMKIDGRPRVVSAPKMFVVLAAVRHLGDGTDPVDRTAVRHAAVPRRSSGT